MNQRMLNNEYIPDSTEAEEWLSEDVFVYQGKLYKVLLNGKVINLNGSSGGEYEPT